MLTLALAATILLAVDDPVIPGAEYRCYIGHAPNAYFDYASSRSTNVVAVTNATAGLIYLAASIKMNGADESDLSEEMMLMLFDTKIQLAPSPDGPWTNYFQVSIPVEIKQPARFVRVKLEIE